jgi:SPP1 gp7 family putative phage head morphogenesis protein
MSALGDQPQELLQQGVQQASDLGLAVGFDVVNQQVLDLSATYTDQWWEQLSGTTRRQMRTAVQTHIEEGTPLRTLVKDLEPLFGKKRAKLIAATEVTRLYTEGNRVAFEDSGAVDQVKWQTVKDAVVDPDCEALQGQQWPLGQNPVSPPLHPNCRCWLAPVVDEKPLTRKVQAP